MNDQNRNQVIALVFLIVPLMGAVYYSMNAIPGGESTTTAAASTSSGGTESGTVVEFKSVFEDVDVDLEELMEKTEQEVFDYGEVKVARDPAIPVKSGTGTIFDPPFPPTSDRFSADSIIFLAERKVVSAIIEDRTSPMKSLAVIDEEVVGIGHEYRPNETEEAIIVKTIGPDFVVFSIPSEQQEITKELIKEQ